MSVGIERMPSEPETPAELSIFPKTMSGFFSDAASKVGPNMRLGPHHSAQKSSTTNALSWMVDSMLSLVISRVATMTPRFGALL
jgi:hypothetical protein